MLGEATPMTPLEDVSADLESAANESDYTAVNALWLALLKLAILEEGRSELNRMGALINRIPDAIVQDIVGAEAVDSLINLDPPLETVVSHPREKLETNEVTDALNRVRSNRAVTPREGLAGLGFVLKAIRNKREHGFKTRFGPRDAEILRPARLLLDQLCRAAYQARTP
jgi:hypothetical protein